MSAAFWVRRFLVAFIVALVVIAGAQLLKGHTLEYSVTEGLLWSLVAASVYTGVALNKWRRGRQCAVCGDTPEGVEPKRDHEITQPLDR